MISHIIFIWYMPRNCKSQTSVGSDIPKFINMLKRFHIWHVHLLGIQEEWRHHPYRHAMQIQRFEPSFLIFCCNYQVLYDASGDFQRIPSTKVFELPQEIYKRNRLKSHHAPLLQDLFPPTSKPRIPCCDAKKCQVLPNDHDGRSMAASRKPLWKLRGPWDGHEDVKLREFP